MTLRHLVAGFALLLVAIGAGWATPITGGTTTVTLTEDFLDLGLTLTPLGSASIAGPVATFPITGGDADESTLAGTFEHDGSGLSLTDGTSVINLENFLINTISSLVFGDITVDGTPVGNAPLFMIGAGLELTLSMPAQVLIAGTFDVDDDDLDFTIGVAAVDPEFAQTAPIPEPSTWFLLLSGCGLLAAGSHRFRAMRR